MLPIGKTYSKIIMTDRTIIRQVILLRFVSIAILLYFFILPAMAQDNPLPPTITRLTVDTISQKARIEWEPSSSSNIIGYILYRFNGSYYPPVDTFSATARSAEYSKSIASSESEWYGLSALNAAGKVSWVAGMDGGQQQTIFLKSIRDTCSGNVNLIWNSYPAISSDIKGYKVYILQNSQWKLMSDQAAKDTIYSDDNGFTSGAYLVEAYTPTLRVYSNQPEIPASMRPFLSIDSFFVAYTGTNLNFSAQLHDGKYNDTLVLYQSANCNEKGAEIYRKAELTAGKWQYSTEGTVLNQYFRAEIHTRCNTIPQKVCTIPLILSAKQDNQRFILNWTKIEEETGYKLLITTSTNNQTITTSDTSYEFVPGDEYISASQLCFQIFADHDQYGNEVVSNTVCLVPEPVIFVPEVFTPNGDGKNDYFKPSFKFEKPVSYKFTVYDRNGRTIYHSERYDELGWDGKTPGRMALSGEVFVYILEYTLSDTTTHRQKGSIVVYLPFR
jgi:gliding motility-associated-like protein